MTTPHKDAPEQWDRWDTIEMYASVGVTVNVCLLELRDRLAAAEQRIGELEGNSSAGLTSSNHPAIPDSSPAPADGLVERVAEVIADSDSPVDLWYSDSRAAILAVADWLDRERIQAWAADRLREEVERG